MSPQPQRYRAKRKPPARAVSDAERAASLALLRPEATSAYIREMYLTHCSPALHAYLTAPAYGLLFADAHSSIHPDLIGPVASSRDEALALREAARTSRPDVPCVVVAGVTRARRAALEEHGFHIPDADLMAPGTRIFIDRFGRTPKALLRAHRREGQPLEPTVPMPRVGVL